MIYLNGQFLPLAEARISPLDRGFLFGDGAYEVIPVYSRRPFRLEEHLNRLERTLSGILIPNPLSRDQWREVVEKLVADFETEDQSIYLHVSRGADTKRDHAFPADIQATVFAIAFPLKTADPALLEHGIACVTAADNRWLRCDLKSTALLGNILLRQQAVSAGCVETILFRDGFLTEGSASNVFMVRDGVIYTPPPSHLMLTGITYDIIVDLARQHGQPLETRDILEAEVRQADEVWISSSTKEVLPVTELDGRPIADGQPGPLVRRMYDWYQDFKNSVMRTA